MPIEPGHSNQLLAQAVAIGEPDDEPEPSDTAPARAPEPATGSYERFMSTFASPARWAGR